MLLGADHVGVRSLHVGLDRTPAGAVGRRDFEPVRGRSRLVISALVCVKPRQASLAGGLFLLSRAAEEVLEVELPSCRPRLCRVADAPSTDVIEAGELASAQLFITSPFPSVPRGPNLPLGVLEEERLPPVSRPPADCYHHSQYA